MNINGLKARSYICSRRVTREFKSAGTTMEFFIIISFFFFIIQIANKSERSESPSV